MRAFLIYIVFCGAAAFQGVEKVSFLPKSALSSSQSKEPEKRWNPIREAADMISNFDDVIDDFMNKRMGNGELFYGKRKFKPSGRLNTEGRYNGMGMSDPIRIDAARAKKEEILERRKKWIEVYEKDD